MSADATGGAGGTSPHAADAAGGGATGSGGSVAGGSVAAGSSEGVVAMTFDDVRTFLGTSILGMSTCFDCHASRLPQLFKDDDTLYDRLTKGTVERCNGHALVVPGEPENSVLYLVLKGECGTVGRMPSGCYESPDGLENNCTPTADIERIRLWIEAGAPR